MTAAPPARRGRLVADGDHLGTPEADWLGSGALDAVAAWDPTTDLGPVSDVVVVAPHPDDEVLGPGATTAALARAGARVHLVAVTDGGGSHPASPTLGPTALAARRVGESAEGLRRLGLGEVAGHRLGVPDGHVAAAEDDVAAAVAGVLDRIAADRRRPGRTAVLAPWVHDGHRDHDATGRAVAAAASARTAGGGSGAVVVEYLVWAWHWATPAGGGIPLDRARRFGLTRHQAATKRWASSAYRSQIRPLGPLPGDEVVLPAPVLRRAWRRCEVTLPHLPPTGAADGGPERG